MAQDIVDFIHDFKLSDAPETTIREAERCVLDLLAVAAGGKKTPNSKIVETMVKQIGLPAPGVAGARLLFDGTRLSLPMAAMANATTIDSLDGHDGQRACKGHAGVVILPAVLAFSEEASPCSGEEFLARMIMGYEIACRAGEALHGTVPDYHTSGAWNGIAAAAIGARALGLDREQTRHALGTAEYYGPRSQMMRCIDFPTMVKDGATMGGFVGVLSALLAQEGFTGAPAITLESEEAAPFWADLGQSWEMENQYLKPYPVCRWAQPAIFATQKLVGPGKIDQVEKIRIETFHNAVRLAVRRPLDTEQAQYSLPFTVAARAVRGKLGADEVAGSGLSDPKILSLSDEIELVEADEPNANFPAKRQARALVTMRSGETLDSGIVEPMGDPETRLTDSEIAAKFDELAGVTIDSDRRARLQSLTNSLRSANGVQPWLQEVVTAA